MGIEQHRVLFLSASFFGYQYEIKKSMEMQGCVIDYYDERPANTFFVKAIIRINRNFIAQYIDKYHNHIIEETRNHKYDYIFIIKGESISSKTIKKLKSAHPTAKLIIYHWDSIANNKNALSTLSLFDKAFSFDKQDCEKLELTFLPLFYINDYQEVAKDKRVKDIDVLFIGTAHSDRYKLITSITEGLKSYLYIYFPSIILYYTMKVTGKSLKKTKRGDFKFRPISKEQMLELYKRTRSIVDVQHPRQTGLTMRTIEVLGAKRKLITTNNHIVEYDFYNPNNILVVDRKRPVVTNEFIESPYQEISEDIYDRYRIDNWIRTILK